MNTFDVNEFLKEHGVVTDKNEAIELLCKTNKAWDVLSPSLQSDPDVIMFFQPSGHMVCFGDEDAGVILTKVTKLAEWNFAKPSYKKFADYKVPIDGLVPFIDIPEGFDWDKYFQIQTEMMYMI